MYQRFSSPFKRHLGRVVSSIAFMVGLLVAALMAPAPILFAIMGSLMPSKDYVKHAAYFTYFGMWILLYIYVYLTGDGYIPEVALVALTLTLIAAVSGYFPLVWTGRFGLRTLLVAATVIAVVLGFAVMMLRGS
jgi:hypothetical protein